MHRTPNIYIHLVTLILPDIEHRLNEFTKYQTILPRWSNLTILKVESVIYE